MKLTHFLALLGVVLILNVAWLFAQTGAQVNPTLRVADEPTIHWINEARIKNSTAMEQYSPLVLTAWLGTNKTDVEFGLCEDGSVVWRKVKTAQ